jgi:hypothetical protein
MQGGAPVDASFTFGAAAWPLVAGLSIVLWSKVRAWCARAVAIPVRP